MTLGTPSPSAHRYALHSGSVALFTAVEKENLILGKPAGPTKTTPAAGIGIPHSQPGPALLPGSPAFLEASW